MFGFDSSTLIYQEMHKLYFKKNIVKCGNKHA